MPLSAIDTNLIVALRALLREQNVTRAGKAIGLSQSAMSHALRRLRAHFGDPLLVQAGHGLTLTILATALIEPVNQVLAPATYYHGTKADLKVGDLIAPGYVSNYGSRKQANFVYLSATLEAAIWGAELAVGEGRGRIYVVEPTGAIEDDPNLTNKRFPGNPTKSYRSRSPLSVVGEIVEWTGHSPERLKEMQDHLQKLREQGVEAIEE